MKDSDKSKRNERRGSLSLALFFTVAAIIYLWIWLFDGLDMDSPWVGPLGSLLFGMFCISSWLIYYVKLPHNSQEQILPIIKLIGYLVIFAWLIFGLMMVVLPLLQQSQHWLEFGEAPPRDLFGVDPDGDQHGLALRLRGGTVQRVEAGVVEYRAGAVGRLASFNRQTAASGARPFWELPHG